MRATRLLKKIAKGKGKATNEKAKKPEDPMKGFHTQGTSSSTDRAGKRYYDTENAMAWSPVIVAESRPIIGFRPNEG